MEPNTTNPSLSKLQLIEEIDRLVQKIEQLRRMELEPVPESIVIQLEDKLLQLTLLGKREATKK